MATHLTGTATFEGGLAADLINNVRVEAEGHVSSGVFLAGKIKFDDAARIEANADLAGSANVLGKTVVTTSLTDFAGLTGGVAGIVLGQGLTVRGFANPDGSITATRIEGQSNPVDVRRIIIQGVVDSFSAPQSTVTVMGITISATTFELNEQPVSADQFFAQLKVGRTVVRGRGSFNAATSTLTADAVGIE